MTCDKIYNQHKLRNHLHLRVAVQLILWLLLSRACLDQACEFNNYFYMGYHEINFIHKEALNGGRWKAFYEY
jgi:hypothetical protein